MQLEHALLRSLRWLAIGLLAAPVLLLLPQPPTDDLLLWTTVHLGGIVVLGVATTWDLARFVDVGEWFEGISNRAARRFASAGALVALATGVVALVTLATSAALRLDVSLQFLQLLSGLDIAWSVAALYFGVRWLWGESAGRIAAVVLALICVWSIWNYLRIVGFTPPGGWLVDGEALLRWVLPFDTMAAVAALAALTVAARQPTEQASAQS